MLKTFKKNRFFIVTVLFLCIFFAPSLVSAEMQQLVQEPKGNTMDLVDFQPKLSQYPISIKYPASWYVREEFEEGGAPSLFITREPVRSFTDRYLVGFAEYFFIDYRKGDIRSYDEFKTDFVNTLQKQGSKIITVNDIQLFGKKAFRIDYQSNNTRVIGLYRVGDDHLMALTFEAPITQFDEYKHIFDLMIQSIELQT